MVRRAGRTEGLVLETSASTCAVSHSRASAVQCRLHLVLAVVVIVIPAFVVVMVPAVSVMRDVFRQLPHFQLPLHPPLLVPAHAVDQAAGNEGDGHEQDNDGAHS